MKEREYVRKFLSAFGGVPESLGNIITWGEVLCLLFINIFSMSDSKYNYFVFINVKDNPVIPYSESI